MDNPSPHKISIEDELRILQALEKIGKEKGVDLLSVAQKKRLADLGGTIHETQLEMSSPGFSGVRIDDLIIYALKNAIVDVLIEKGLYTREKWEIKNEVAKMAILSVYVEGCLGIDLEEWINEIHQKFRR